MAKKLIDISGQDVMTSLMFMLAGRTIEHRTESVVYTRISDELKSKCSIIVDVEELKDLFDKRFLLNGLFIKDTVPEGEENAGYVRIVLNESFTKMVFAFPLKKGEEDPDKDTD